MSKIYTSRETVSRAYHKVRMELWKLGVLWAGSKLDKVECIHDPIPLECIWRSAEGLWKKKLNAIVFPMFYLAGGEKDSCIDIFRHEFGHALADKYPKALRNGDLFKKAFGGPYGDRAARGTSPDDWEGRCVSGYAATATQEDFAETFMFYLKHKGKIPARFAKKPAIRKKWKAVAKIIRRVAASDR